jgi:hypothetical protein
LTQYGSLRDAVCEKSAPGGRFVARPGPQRGEPCRVHRRNLRQFAALSDSLSAAALWALKTTRRHPLIYVRRRSQPVAHLPLSGVEKFKHTALVISQRASAPERENNYTTALGAHVAGQELQMAHSVKWGLERAPRALWSEQVF